MAFTDAWKLLVEKANRDLREKPEKETARLQSAFDAILGAPEPSRQSRGNTSETSVSGEEAESENGIVINAINPTSPQHEWHPAWILRIHDSGWNSAKFVLFEDYWIRTIPGPNYFRFTILEEGGHPLRTEVMDIGWRTYLNKITTSKNQIPGKFLIILHTTPGNAADIRREYLLFEKNRLILLRLENSHRQPVRNDYNLSGWIIGPHPDRRTYYEWEAMLASNETVSQLCALQWFAGLHWTSVPEDAACEAPGDYEKNGAELYLLKISDTVKKLLEKLTLSSNLWVRQGAYLALSDRKD